VRRRDRLSGSRQFAAVRSARISATAGVLRVSLAANGLDHARLGFSIPKGVGGAVARNTVRRRLRAALQPRRQELAGLDVVVNASAESARRSFTEIEADLAACLARTVKLARSRTGVRGDARERRLAENGPIGPGPRPAFAPSAL
jgi:ribonuclease P protein component